MRLVMVAVAATAVLSVQPAAATVVTIAVTGTVGFGLDNLGLFGGIGQSLRGVVYTMDYAYDITNAIDAGNSRQANGGTSFNRPSPIVRANLSINGITLSVIDPYSATYDRFLFPTSSILTFGTGGPNGINGGGLTWSRTDQGIALALDAPVNRTFDASDSVFSAFQRANAQLTKFTYLSLQPRTIVVATAAVPEPGIWALMVVGFGLIGVSARRPRQRSANTCRSACAPGWVSAPFDAGPTVRA